jgi:hypothetical protein
MMMSKISSVLKQWIGEHISNRRNHVNTPQISDGLTHVKVKSRANTTHHMGRFLSLPLDISSLRTIASKSYKTYVS